MARFLTGFCLVLLMACGNSAQRQEVRNQLALVREQIRIMDAELAPTDDVGKQLLSQSSDNLKRVERLLIEDELIQASTMLDNIAKRLAEHTQKISGDNVDSGSSFYSHFGLVTFSEDGQNFRDITEVETIQQIRSVKTSTRSGVRLNFTGAVSFELNANSQVDFVPVGADRVDALLTRGVVVVSQSKATPAVSVSVGGIKVNVVSAPFIAEFSNQELVKRRYVGVHVGKAEWLQIGGTPEPIAADQALWWGKAGAELVALVQRPVVDNPSNNETIGIQESTGKSKVHFRWHANSPTPRFQLQVGTQPNFFTRVYDNANLTGNGQFVELDPGLYYFRVRGITDEGVPGPFTETFKLTVSANQLSTVSEVEYVAPKGPDINNVHIEVIGETAIITGQTNKPTNKISVNGIGAVMMEDGKFRAIVTFTNYGMQDVTVVGLDPATGGESSVSRQVNVGR